VTTVSDLATAFGLNAAQEGALGRYVDLLLGWRLGNVTAVRTREDAVDRLLGDSLALLDVPALAVAGDRWLDLGAGAGIPGIPLAVARPAARLTLLDAARKKCAFLEAAVGATGLEERAAVVCARSEAFAAPSGDGREAFDAVLVRAVAGLAAVVELTAPLLAAGGVVLAVKAAAGAADEGPAGDAAAMRCGLSPGTVTPLTRSPLDGSVCVVYDKRDPAPDWLPRRPGLAARRPLAS
jgi:16S rRNA (guanine527-N7)-methyltransferase